MRICVTGADGFIGSHLADSLLELGHEVRALVQYNSTNSTGWLEPDRENLEVVAGDIRDPSQMDDLVHGVEQVFHLAALIAIPHSYSAPNSYVATNVLGTQNLLNSSRKHGVKRFIHTSTSEVYGSAIRTPIDETHPLQAQSPYSASKIGADALAQSYWTSFDLPVVTIRPFNTFGPRQSLRAVIPTVLAQIASGRSSISLGAVSPTRDFTYVSDTVRGFLASMSAPNIEGETINLGTGYEISIGSLVELAGEVSGRRLEINTHEVRMRPENSEVERLVSDNSKALSLLDWRPELQGVEGLRAGLQKTLDWITPLVKEGNVDATQYVR